MLAEALARKHYPDKNFESSGTKATEPVAQTVKNLVEKNNLKEFVSYNPEPASAHQIKKAERIICMKECHRKFIEHNFDVRSSKIEIWDIPDADPEDNLQPIFEELEGKVENMF